jgi:lipoprotein-releasing system permease protein
MVNLPAFIASRLSSKDKENLSGPVVRIAVTTIALGLAVMILAVAVLIGFQTEIRNKVIGFSAHIQIDNFDANASYEAAPVSHGTAILSRSGGCGRDKAYPGICPESRNN